jgi:Protein of unknown function (DUF4245)
MAGKPRGSETVGDAVRSLVALLGIVAAIVIAFTVMRPDPRGPQSVDYSGILEHVRAEYPYPVLAPTPVPPGWTATSVEQTPAASGNRWRLGFVTDDDGFVGLEQSDGEIESFLADRLEDFTEDGTVEVDGATWQRWIESGDAPDRALVLNQGGVATVVLGTEPYGVLEEFAASLGP